MRVTTKVTGSVYQGVCANGVAQRNFVISVHIFRLSFLHECHPLFTHVVARLPRREYANRRLPH